MKRFLITAIFLSSFVATFAQSSPYVENTTLVVNNQGFNSTSKRVTALSHPVPFHNAASAINATVSPRFQVGKADASLLGLFTTGTWAAANGWLANVDLGIIDVTIALTGCQSYGEALLLADAGQWRVPTQRELILIYLVHKELESRSGFANFNTTDNYWSSTQGVGTTAWAMNMNTGANFSAPRGNAYRVRCVKDL